MPVYMFNAPRSEQSAAWSLRLMESIPAGGLWRAYTYLDEVTRIYREPHQRRGLQLQSAGNKIPASRRMSSTARLAMTKMSGRLQAGALSKCSGRIPSTWTNANLLKAPGYELLNLNVHYKTD